VTATSPSIETIKAVRERTGAGLSDVKKALVDAHGDIEKAIDLLRERGIAKATRSSGREAREGFVGAYLHHTGKVGVLVALSCETDFVARNEELRALAKDLAMHIAIQNPQFVAADEIPAEVLEREREVALGALRQDPKNEKKPAEVLQKIVDGKLKKFVEEVCLVEQKFVRDENTTVGDHVKSIAGKLGENIGVVRFARLEIGGR
jgi:elongation factor Ts